MRIKKDDMIQALKFTLFSASAAVIQVVSFELLTLIFAEWAYYARYIPSLVLSVVWNCTFNRAFTFKSAVNLPKAMVLAILFYVPFLPLSTIAGNALANRGWNDFVILILTMICNFVLEFLWQKFVVFKDNTKEVN